LAFYAELQVFRATNRYSIFLLALALLFLTGRLSRLGRHWSAAGRCSLAVALLLVGLWDQIPRPAPAAVRRQQAELLAADQDLARRLEARLGAGAMVFQLPVVDFPEGSPRHRMAAYDHFRLYVTSETLRFTYGSKKNRSKGRWQLDAERLPPGELIRVLEECGFSGLSINCDAYADEGRELLQALAAAGYRETLQGTFGRRVVLPLKPAEEPRLPLARRPTFGSGWHPRPREGNHEGRWARGPAVLSYHNPYPTPLAVEASMRLNSFDQRQLVVRFNGRPAGELCLGPESRELVLNLLLQPGINRLDLDTDQPPARVTEGRWSLRTFRLHSLTWQLNLPAGGTIVGGIEPRY
jgi:hypothetical protein